MAKSTGDNRFGIRLKSLREAAGLSQSALAERVDIDRVHLAHIERGARPDPRWSTIQAIATALGISTEDLRTDQVSEKKSKKSGV